MNLRDLFPSNYVAASDLHGKDVPVVIARIGIEKVGTDQEDRPVLFFNGMGKGLVLNKTNAKRIAKMYGEAVEAWVGKAITLYGSETDFQGETVPCIRVRADAPGMAPGPTAVATPPALPTF